MRATVVFNRRISTAYRHLGLRAPDFPGAFRPGQFVMIRPTGVGDPFLPRAFSIYRISGPRDVATPDGPAAVVEILYKILGKGTRYLARMEPGQELELLGPLGNSFTLPAGREQAVLVAGGIGVPPIAALAGELARSREPRTPWVGASQKKARESSEPRTSYLVPRDRDIEVFLGGKTSEDILCVKDFEEASANVHITTEDGSLGIRGLISDLLDSFLLPASSLPLTMYTCGPAGMLAAVARLAAERRISCQVSVEANMACGFGACMGCAVEVEAKERQYKLVCKDGPVFDSLEIRWGAER